MKQHVVLVSFGTSHDAARHRCIDAMAEAIQAAHPNWEIHQAYTSRVVRRILAKRGITIPSIEEAIEALAAKGVRRVVLQPTLLVSGEEYEKLLAAARVYSTTEITVLVGKPLLSTTDDMQAVVEAVVAQYPCNTGQALVLMGHGTPCATNTIYAALDYMCKQRGYPHIFVGTVEAYPDIDIVAKMVHQSGYTKARLAPLMLVAGDHAVHDMAGDGEDSWRQKLMRLGIEVDVSLCGLGAYTSIHAIYERHIEEVLRGF